MARVHYFQFLVNETGEPVEGAEISIFLANTQTPAKIYTAETGGELLTDSPQMVTLSNGFFQFWIADQSGVDDGYLTSQKFKISWEKTGISEGYIDYIDIFPAIKFVDGVDETDMTRIEKDKTVSNQLAYGWETHKDYNIITEGLPVHGLDLINFQLQDEVPNKLMSNKLGWEWDQHRISTVQVYNPSAGTPHGIEEIQDGSYNTVKNKLISSYIISRMRDDINALTGGVYSTDFQAVYTNSNPLLSPYNPNIGFQTSTGKGFTIGNSTNDSFFTVSADEMNVYASGNLRADGGLEINGTLTTIDTTNFTTSSQLLEFNGNEMYQGLMAMGEAESYIIFDGSSSSWKVGDNLIDSELYEIIHSNNISQYITPDEAVVPSASWIDNGDTTFSYTVYHNLGTDYPLVTVWNTATQRIISPNEVVSLDSNSISVNVSNAFDAIIRAWG